MRFGGYMQPASSLPYILLQEARFIRINPKIRHQYLRSHWALEQRRLLHQHHRVAHLDGARSANGPPDPDVIVRVVRGGPENPQITPQLGLRVRRHDAAQRRPQLHHPDVLTHFEGSLQPVTLYKALNPWCGFDDNVWAKAAGIELRIGADQRAQMGERAAGH